MTHNKTTDLWEDCMTEIFTYGNVNTEFTGGLRANGSAQINENPDGYLRLPASNANTIFTKGLINLTNFNRAYASINRVAGNSGGLILLAASTPQINITSSTNLGEFTVTSNNTYQTSSLNITNQEITTYLGVGAIMAGVQFYCNRLYLI